MADPASGAAFVNAWTRPSTSPKARAQVGPKVDRHGVIGLRGLMCEVPGTVVGL